MARGVGDRAGEAVGVQGHRRRAAPVRVADPACNDEGIQDTVVVVDAADAGRVPTKDKHRNSNAGGTRNRHPLGCLAIGLIFSHVRMPRISTLRYKLSDFGPFPLTEVTDAGACSR